MWAALPLQSLKPWPPNAISTAKSPPRRHHPVAVYKLQNQNREEKGGFGLGLGQAVITALKTNPRHNQNDAKSNRKSPPPEKQEEKELSGADVLMALQIVAAQKAKKKKETRDSSKNRNNNYNKSNNAERNHFRDFSNVRPLCIHPDWTARLEELELRLEQLADT